jgi:hypothetical protein
MDEQRSTAAEQEEEWPCVAAPWLAGWLLLLSRLAPSHSTWLCTCWQLVDCGYADDIAACASDGHGCVCFGLIVISWCVALLQMVATRASTILWCSAVRAYSQQQSAHTSTGALEQAEGTPSNLSAAP